MINCYTHYLSKLLKVNSNITSEEIDYIIKTKHKYLLVKGVTTFLIDVENNYDSVEFDAESGEICLITKVSGSYHHNHFKLNEFNDILGFADYQSALSECSDSTYIFCSEPETKVVFSPQLANYLLSEGFKIVNLKKNINDGSTIFVFAAEKGLGLALENYSKRR